MSDSYDDKHYPLATATKARLDSAQTNYWSYEVDVHGAHKSVRRSFFDKLREIGIDMSAWTEDQVKAICGELGEIYSSDREGDFDAGFFAGYATGEMDARHERVDANAVTRGKGLL